MILYYLLLLLTPFLEYPRLPKIGEDFTVIKMIGIVTLFVAIFRAVMMPERLRLFRWAEIRCFAPFAVWILVASILHGFQFRASTVIKIYVSLAMFYFITMVFVDTAEKVRRSCFVILASMFIASLYVYNDYIRWHTPRPAGIVGDPNYYALMVVSILPMSVILLKGSTLFERVFLMGTTASLIASTLLGGSRAGFLGICICFFYLVLRSNRKLLLVGGLGAVSTLFLLVLPVSPLQRLLNPGRDATSSDEIRKLVLRAGLKMIWTSPLTGTGPGSFKDYSVQYSPELPRPFVAHNTYVNIAAELGVPAACLFIAMLFFAWRRGRQLAVYCAKMNLPIGEQLGRSIEIGVVAYGFTAAFLTADHIKHVWLLVFLGLALNQTLLQAPAAAAAPLLRRLPLRQPARGERAGALPAAARSIRGAVPAHGQNLRNALSGGKRFFLG